MLGERASLGTLLELGNCALDQLRDLLAKAPTAKPADKGKSILTGTYETKEDVHAGISVARRTLEVVLTYSVTQLALYLNKPDTELQGAVDDGYDGNTGHLVMLLQSVVVNDREVSL